MLAVVLFSMFLLAQGRLYKNCSVPAMFLFGDSYLDVGNRAALYPEAFQQAGPLPIESNKFPYGITFFRRPTGRFSDGRMISDFLASTFGLQTSGAYLQSVCASFKGGVNFALSQGTALSRSHSYYRSRNISLDNPFSLRDQYAWFMGFRRASATRDKVPMNSAIYSNALYVVGEIGGNDYTTALFFGKVDPKTIPLELTPLVMETIRNVSEELYSSGARKFLFIGLPPMVDSPGYKAALASLNKDALYSLTSNHNRLLRELVNDFKSRHEEVVVGFADFEGMHKDVIAHPMKHGFTNVADACCGGAGPFNVNLYIACGQPGFSMCRDPQSHAYWDLSHYTEHFNKVAVRAFASGHYLEPDNAFSTMCTATFPSK